MMPRGESVGKRKLHLLVDGVPHDPDRCDGNVVKQRILRQTTFALFDKRMNSA